MENKIFYVTIKGKQIEVTEEVYRAYVRPRRNEQRQKRRDWKCKILGPKGNLIRCPNKCEECTYAQAGFKPKGNNLSLDEFRECGVEIIDTSIDLEQKVIEEENRREGLQSLKHAIRQLTKRDQRIVQLFYFQNWTKEKIAQELGVSHQAISKRVAKIHEILRKTIKK